MQQELCKNCHQVHQGNFCSHCGQKTKTVRLDSSYIKDEVKYTILHVNKGFFFTVKELFTRPGETIKEFIEGKRINHYKPLLLVFVLAGINGFLSLQLDFSSMIQQYGGQTQQNAKFMQEYSKVMHWFFAHYAFMEILALPIVSLVSWLSFKKWGYNYIENIIINCFASGQRLVFGIFSILLYIVLPKNAVMQMGGFMALITFGLTIWTYASLYKNHDSKAILLRILLFIFLLLLVGFLLIVIFSLIFVIYLHKSGKI